MSNPFSPKLKKISVITPVYKDAHKTFPQFFQALNEQDYKHFEVIVSFDGKNVTGVKKLKKMMKKYPGLDIKFIVNKWGGAPAARNRGAKEATGDFLTFLDPDIYPYSDTFRFWVNSFEENKDKDVIWGLYEVIENGQKLQVGGGCPTDNGDNPIYWAFRFSNYCSGAFPIRKEAFIGWREELVSLQDWDMWLRMLSKDNYEGKKFKFYRKNFFLTEPVRTGGISQDSHKNWIERVKQVKKLNNIPLSDICVSSLGAPLHGVSVAKMLGADYLPMPSFKPHKYKTIYLLGFYTNHPEAIQAHLRVFNSQKPIKKIIHWIGNDIYQFSHGISVATWKELLELWKKKGYIHLTEVDYTQKEMLGLDVKTKVIPIPPSKLYKPIRLPEKFTVGVYENPTQNVYEEELMAHVARSMPDIQFIFFGDDSKKGKYANVNHVGWIDYDKWLPKLSCNLRITKHDGLPLTAIQFMTAGRNVITNSPLKGAIVVTNDRKDIIAGIRKAQKQPLNKKWSKYWRKIASPERFKKAIRRII
jgi:glycosyltransferase involved in cell wall biosynthesis